MDIAKEILAEIGDIDKVCEVISDLATMLNDKDKRWIINSISQFIRT